MKDYCLVCQTPLTLWTKHPNFTSVRYCYNFCQANETADFHQQYDSARVKSHYLLWLGKRNSIKYLELKYNNIYCDFSFDSKRFLVYEKNLEYVDLPISIVNLKSTSVDEFIEKIKNYLLIS